MIANYKEHNTKNLINSFFRYTWRKELIEFKMSLRNRKVPGYDGITNEIMENVIKVISDSMVFINNKCFETGVFTQSLNISTTQPIYKTGII